MISLPEGAFSSIRVIPLVSGAGVDFQPNLTFFKDRTTPFSLCEACVSGVNSIPEMLLDDVE
jgi:hypothetical protein